MRNLFIGFMFGLVVTMASLGLLHEKLMLLSNDLSVCKDNLEGTTLAYEEVNFALQFEISRNSE